MGFFDPPEKEEKKKVIDVEAILVSSQPDAIVSLSSDEQVCEREDKRDLKWTEKQATLLYGDTVVTRRKKFIETDDFGTPIAGPGDTVELNGRTVARQSILPCKQCSAPEAMQQLVSGLCGSCRTANAFKTTGKAIWYTGVFALGLTAAIFSALAGSEDESKK